MKYLIKADSTDDSWEVSSILTALDKATARAILTQSLNCRAFLKGIVDAKYFGKVRLGWDLQLDVLPYNERGDRLLGDDHYVACGRIRGEIKRSEIHCVEFDVDGTIRLTALDKYSSAKVESEDIAPLILELADIAP